ncbi:ROK family protein [Pseudactinotalea sp. Z1739]|uniref:ROK family protein n=1 Tax=Pseudactinotalea sp. Z1739 TaxID=3413028 RepID=UPI003C7CD45A
MTSKDHVVLGIDIGGQGIKACLLDAAGEVLERGRTPTPRGGQAMLDAAANIGASLVKSHGRPLLAAGIGTAGVVQDGVIVAASSSFTGWVDTPVRTAMQERFGVPVVVENDVNAFLAGEASLGAVRDHRDVLGIALGTGVGGALWLGGALYGGPQAGAGEVGHMPGFGADPCTCGQFGHLETLAAGPAIERRYRERGGAVVTGGAAEVARRARAGDGAAVQVFADAGAGVARAALMVAAMLDVVEVVIGGGLAGAADLLGPAIDEALAAEPPVSGRPIQAHFTALGSSAAAVGAAVLASTQAAAVTVA